MSISQPLPATTAPPNRSIWKHVDERTFRKRIDQLHRKNNVPADHKVHTYQAWQGRRDVSHEVYSSLPFDVEERIANDLASIAAARKDVKAVSAVALEEQENGRGLIVRLATNDAILASVRDVLRSIFVLLQDCATRSVQPF